LSGLFLLQKFPAQEPLSNKHALDQKVKKKSLAVDSSGRPYGMGIQEFRHPPGRIFSRKSTLVMI
jgi:hypothetical protein